MIQKWRKKPVVIEAVQWTGKNIDEVMKFNGLTVRGHAGTISIVTLEGTMDAKVGDFIIKGISGEFYPCKPNIFKKTYEKVK